MSTQEILSHFEQHCFIPALEKELSILCHKFKRDKVELISGFVSSFEAICKQIKNMQEAKQKDDISYIHYSMLRTSILENKGIYLIEAYSEKWYWDEQECLNQYDASWLIEAVTNLQAVLDQERKKYMNQIHPHDIQHMLFSNLGYFNAFFISLSRLAIPIATQSSLYQQISKGNTVKIKVGEYRDFSEDIYIDNQCLNISNDMRTLLYQLKGESDGLCQYHTFTRLTIDAEHFMNVDYSYSDFNRCHLSDSSFRHCVLIGTRFQYCDLRGTDFSFSILTDVDFRGSNLSGACLYGIQLEEIQDPLIRVPGLLGINFEDCLLEGTQIPILLRDKLELTTEQAEMVRWIDEEVDNSATFLLSD